MNKRGLKATRKLVTRDNHKALHKQGATATVAGDCGGSNLWSVILARCKNIWKTLKPFCRGPLVKRVSPSKRYENADSIKL